MVGVLIVSHSPKVAEGALEMATQMVRTDILIAAVGGNVDGEIGTDPDAITQALRQILTPEGVIILADLGSAVMCADTVIEAEGVQGRVIIANAPLVEGTVVAALESSLGKSLPEVVDAAEAAGTMVKQERDLSHPN